MAIVSLQKGKQQPDAEATGQRVTAEEIWILQLDSHTLPIEVVLLINNLSSNNSYNFPVVGNGHSSYSSLISVGFSPKQKDSSYTYYEISVSFDNDRGTVDSSVAPQDEQPSYAFDFVDNVLVIERDTETDEVIANTAGTPIIVTENVPFLRCTIVRNESDYDHKKAKEYIGTINSTGARILGKQFDKETCKLDRWSGVTAYDNEGELYWRITYEILIKDDGFARELIMKGYLAKTDNGDLKPAASSKGWSAGQELKLNEQGKFYALSDQSDPTKFTTKTFNTLRKTSWPSRLGLGSSPASSIDVTTLGLT